MMRKILSRSIWCLSWFAVGILLAHSLTDAQVRTYSGTILPPEDYPDRLIMVVRDRNGQDQWGIFGKPELVVGGWFPLTWVETPTAWKIWPPEDPSPWHRPLVDPPGHPNLRDWCVLQRYVEYLHAPQGSRTWCKRWWRVPLVEDGRWED
ncbi:hypothetical protein AMJ85_09880 [candidate division BRC1 bacterium SM23_51]|nr:MAG: hypothetical protein AMJ85_09880 [candidate division BRC1 bacterium SM23_51]